jgi:hypothetical protein
VDTNKNHVTCPQKRRVNNRRKEQNKWRGRKRWKDLVIKHAQYPGARCVHCLRKHKDPIVDIHGNQKCDKKGKPRFVYLTINHKSRTLYVSEDLYCTWNPELMEVCCNDCNKNIEKGLKPCPKCHHTYIKWYDYTCQHCWDLEHPELAAKAKEEKRKKDKVTRDIRKKIAADQKKKNQPFVEAKKEKDKLFRQNLKKNLKKPKVMVTATGTFIKGVARA